MNTSYFIEAKEVILGYAKVNPLSTQPISFQLKTGCITALIGPNGAGKSTLINTLVGNGTLLKGSISCYGLELKNISPKRLSDLVSIVPQEHCFPSELRVKHFLELAFLPKTGLFKPLPSIDSEEFASIISLLNLRPLFAKPLKNLSAGERQRVFLARALLQRPKFMILDEPTNHLDPMAATDFWRTAIAYKKEQELDILISSHDLGLIQRECDWVVAMKNGNLFFTGPKAQFFSSNLVDELYR